MGSNPRHDEQVQEVMQTAAALWAKRQAIPTEEPSSEGHDRRDLGELSMMQIKDDANEVDATPCIKVTLGTLDGSSFSLQVPPAILVSELRQRVAQQLAHRTVSGIVFASQVQLIDVVNAQVLVDNVDLSTTLAAQGSTTACRLQVILLELHSPLEAYREGAQYSRFARKRSPPKIEGGPGDFVVLLQPRYGLQQGDELQVLGESPSGKSWMTDCKLENSPGNVSVEKHQEHAVWRWKHDEASVLPVAPPYPVAEGDGKQCPRCSSSRAFATKRIIRGGHCNHLAGTNLEWCQECGFLVWFYFSY